MPRDNESLIDIERAVRRILIGTTPPQNLYAPSHKAFENPAQYPPY